MEKENACIFVQLFAFAFKYNVRIERQRMEGSGRCTPPLYPGVVPQAEEGYSVEYNVRFSLQRPGSKASPFLVRFDGKVSSFLSKNFSTTKNKRRHAASLFFCFMSSFPFCFVPPSVVSTHSVATYFSFSVYTASLFLLLRSSYLSFLLLHHLLLQ